MSIGRYFGIPVRLHWSWFIVFILVTWMLGAYYFPDSYPNWDRATQWGIGAATSVLFFASVLAHELAHSRVAQAAGMTVKSITLFVFGGVSQIGQEPGRPSVEFRMAIAGPGTSLLLGAAFWGIFFATRHSVEPLSGLAYWLGYINISLVAFNLIPGFPLDGGRVLRSILWWRSGNVRSATRTASDIGRGVGFLFIFGGIALIFLNRSYWLSGIWLALIGWFLDNAAVGSYRQVALQDMLQGHTVSEVMSRDCQVISPSTTVEQTVNDYILKLGSRCLPVVEDGHTLGIVTLNNVKSMARELWPIRTVREAMMPLDKAKSVGPNDGLSKAMQLLNDEDLNQLPVMEGNSIVGMVGRDNLLSFIHARAELGM
ncbi:MAG: site-2 protease family protein [Dehalococcoidia bacterium]|nr:site-2 protease family protein [Dehalococcoidia bacterium]